MPNILLAFWSANHLSLYPVACNPNHPSWATPLPPNPPGFPANSPSRPKNPKEGGIVPRGIPQGVQSLQLIEVELPVRGRAHQPCLQECGPLPLQGPRAPHVPLADSKGALLGRPAEPPGLPGLPTHHRILYLADTGHPSHHLLCIAVILHCPLAEEEVDLVIVSCEAAHALWDVGRAYKMRFYGKGRRVSRAGAAGPLTHGSPWAPRKLLGAHR